MRQPVDDEKERYPMCSIRLLFLSDTHLGFDLPRRPRIERRRRGHDFFANYEWALKPAFMGQVDAVVHGGDLLFRSKVHSELVQKAFEPLKQIASTGIPVYLVPGNHERSAIPHAHLVEHDLIHIFDRPKTFILQKREFRMALAGFPFVGTALRENFSSLLAQTGWWTARADIYVLCIHQALDGATVGPVNYQFRFSSDVVNPSDVPYGFSAVLAGHIHRFQVLTNDLHSRQMRVPVFYAGSIERTSFAERNEPKGYLILEFDPRPGSHAAPAHWSFHKLPVRPMIQLDVHAEGMNGPALQTWIKDRIRSADLDSIVQLKIHGRISPEAMAVVQAQFLRSLAPPSMNIECRYVEPM